VLSWISITLRLVVGRSNELNKTVYCCQEFIGGETRENDPIGLSLLLTCNLRAGFPVPACNQRENPAYTVASIQFCPFVHLN
jgi:hypothetical protein